MLNRIWLGMIGIGILVAAVNGRLEAVSTAILNSAQDSVETVIKLLGPMCLWLGLMEVAEKAKLTELLAKLFKPLAAFLFPDVPQNHSALGAIVMNLAANMLGLGNSATPLGIKAMHRLQELNPEEQRATNAMCTFLVINTSSVTLIPTTVLALRSGAGSQAPTEIIGTTLFATTCSTIVGVIANKLFIKLGAVYD